MRSSSSSQSMTRSRRSVGTHGWCPNIHDLQSPFCPLTTGSGGRGLAATGLVPPGHEAAVAEGGPRRRLRAADLAAADGRIVDLGAELPDDPGGGCLLERGGLLDRDPCHTWVLEREPAQDRRLPRRLLCLPELRRLEPARIEEPADQRPLLLVAGDRARERAEQRQPVLVDRR